MAPAGVRANGTRQRGLQIDNVVGSHPELGPAPPDGGYGWIIVICVMLLRLSLPSVLLVSYGIFIMKANESNEPLQALLTNEQSSWNGVTFWVPVLFSAIWSFTDPWSRTLAAITSTRFTAACGILLTSVGLIATKFVINLADPIRFFLCCLTSGLMTGVGVSLSITPADHLVTHYFRQRLAVAQTFMRVAQAVGYCAMPLVTCILLLHYGYQTTLIIQAAIVLQGLIAVAAFRKPIYLQPHQQGLAYTLLQNEDENTSASKNEPQSASHQESQLEGDPDREGQDSPQPFYDSMPRPLFSDVELAASGQDLAFFIEDPTDEEVVLYVYGDHLRRGVKCTEEIKMFCRPIFYAGLLLLATTRITNITFWLLLPSLAMSRNNNLRMVEAAGILSATGIMDIIVAIGGHWLLSVSPLAKKRLTSMACFVAAGGLYALSYDRKLLWLICASVVQRLGASTVDIISKPMLKEEMGHVEFRHAHNLLDVLTGLTLLLTTLALGKDYGFSFWILSWVQIAAGTVWGLQPIVGMLCSKRSAH